MDFDAVFTRYLRAMELAGVVVSELDAHGEKYYRFTEQMECPERRKLVDEIFDWSNDESDVH